MSLTIDFAPLVPVWLIVGLAAIGVAMIGFAVRRRVAAAWLRAVAATAMALALVNPVIIAEDREALPTTVALVVDQSVSQRLENRSETTDIALEALSERLQALDGIDVRMITARQAGGADGTELFAAVNAGLADVPPDRVGAVIMITDGQVHDAPATADELGGAPVHALITGRYDEIDRRIELVDAPRFGIVGEEQEIYYRVVDDGTDADGTIAIGIYRDGELVERVIATIGAEESYRFIVPHGGDVVFELVADTLDDELTDINNHAVVELDGIRENLRVLLVSGEPHAGELTWRDLLKSDTAVDLIHFTILRPPEKFDLAPQEELALIAFPIRELFSVTLNDFDLVIFDRYQEQGALPLVYFENIARYVSTGGALLIAAGPDDAGPTSIYSTALASVLPVRPTGEMIETPYRAMVTDLGLRHPVTRDLPGAAANPPEWSRWFRIAAAEEPAGDVIMGGPDGMPLLVLGHQGDGRVAMLLSDHAWLWARGYEGGGPHVDLLRRISHWLMKEPELEEEALRATAADGLLTIERQTMDAEAGPVVVRSPLGVEQDVILAAIGDGLWRAEIPANEIGIWRIADGDRIAVAHIGPPNPREFIDPRSTEMVLQPAVDDGNGHISRLEGGTDIPRIIEVGAGSNFGGGDWLGIRMTEASTLLGLDRIPLFAGFIGLTILAGLLAATWFREGH